MVRDLFNRIYRFKRKHIAAISVAAIGIAGLIWILFVPTNTAITAPQEVSIIHGQGPYQIANTLKERKLIRSSGVFTAYVVARGWERKLKAGDYIIPENSSLVDIAYALVDGRAKSDDIVVLIPEGSNIWEVDDALSDRGLLAAGQFALKFQDQEGYIFPDTYRFKNPRKERMTIQAIGEKMLSNFENRTGHILGNTSAEQKKKILTVASMLEKEARTGDDLRLVAGIIEKRMDIDMLLQIDATVSYGACLRNFQATKRNCDVTLVGVRKEIDIDGPYNSYTRKGLPPGPISNPGLQAIQAAMHPQKSDYLYYLSTRDGSRMIFSKTIEEHNANRRKYLGI